MTCCGRVHRHLLAIWLQGGHMVGAYGWGTWFGAYDVLLNPGRGCFLLGSCEGFHSARFGALIALSRLSRDPGCARNVVVCGAAGWLPPPCLKTPCYWASNDAGCVGHVGSCVNCVITVLQVCYRAHVSRVLVTGHQSTLAVCAMFANV
jgi:hypothetical protein